MPTVGMLFAFPVLLVAGLGVRFAGSSRILNIVNYSRISDIPALHRWAGNRLLLLLLPVLTLVLVFSAIKFPAWALPSFVVFLLAILSVVIWIAVGSPKFQLRR